MGLFNYFLFFILWTLIVTLVKARIWTREEWENMKLSYYNKLLTRTKATGPIIKDKREVRYNSCNIILF